MTPRVIVLATKNPGKLREIRQVLAGLNVRIAGLEEFAPVQEPEETGQTFADNARDKAAWYARATGQWCLADDSGLAVDALGGQPGVRSARYGADQLVCAAGRAEIDAANNRKLLAALDGVPREKRTARFVCCLALGDGERTMIQTCDSVEGWIAFVPRGHNGFGYDPLFNLADREGVTMAQLPAQEKNAISHRGKALRRFATMLDSLLR